MSRPTGNTKAYTIAAKLINDIMVRTDVLVEIKDKD